jgi:hypothetical protein
VLDYGQCRTIQIALIIETRVAQKLGILCIGGRPRRPLEEFGGKSRWAELREIGKEDGACVGGHGRQQGVSRSLAATAPTKTGVNGSNAG